MVSFSCRLFSNILKYRDDRWDLSKFWKKGSFSHVFKSTASMCASSVAQFFRTTTGKNQDHAPFIN